MRKRVCFILVAILLASGPLQAQGPALVSQPGTGEAGLQGGLATFEGYYVVPLDQRTRIIKVSPYKVDTEMLRVGRPGASPRMSAEDVAGVVLYLLGDAPSAMTGSCVDVFG